MHKFEPSTAHLLTASEARELIDQGLLTSQELVTACFARIDEVEETIGAWIHVDKSTALEQARQAVSKFALSGSNLCMTDTVPSLPEKINGQPERNPREVIQQYHRENNDCQVRHNTAENIE